MYEDSCPHGYIPASCAECRVAAVGETDVVGELFGRFMAQHKGGQRSGWLTRRTEITTELARLEGYARRSKAQDDQLHELTSELTVLGSLIDQDDVRVRSETIARGMELMKDPANCEGPAGFAGAPALVKDARHDRLETPAESLQRMLSIDLLESTTMDGVLTTGGHKGLLLMDGNSYLIVDRIGTQMIYEPLVASSGGILPSGTSGWFAWSRTGADVSTATALRVHSTT